MNPDICWIGIGRQRAQNKASASPPLLLAKHVLVKNNFISRKHVPGKSGAAMCSRRGLWGGEGRHEPLSVLSPYPMPESSHPAHHRHSGNPLQSPAPTVGQNQTSAATHVFQVGMLFVSSPFLENTPCLHPLHLRYRQVSSCLPGQALFPLPHTPTAYTGTERESRKWSPVDQPLGDYSMTPASLAASSMGSCDKVDAQG